LLSSISAKRAARSAFKLFCTPLYRNLKKLPLVFEKAEKLQFRFEKFRIKGYRWNHPAEKKLLILHGFESSVINFDRYIKPFTRKGFEVLAFDAPAHGRSSGKQINALIYKRFILELIKEYGPYETYMAHSLGGLALALTLEEMKHDANTKVVLIAPATETQTAVQSFYQFLMLNEKVQKEFEKHILDLGGKPANWYSIGRVLKKLKASILWFHDEDDIVTPFIDVEPLLTNHPSNVSFIISKGLGHSRIYRDNNVKKQIVDFV
jgi:pimeloyl-ACP methyl ester carboxylesterase